MKSYDIVIIGAGIVGLSIAYELRLRNQKLRIAVVEKGTPGKEASWASVGMLEPQLIITQDFLKEENSIQRLFLNLCIESQFIFEEYIRRIEWVSKVNCEYRKEGILKLIPPDETADEKIAWLARIGIRGHYWSPEETEEREPALAEGYSAIHLPGNHQVENRKLVKALTYACKQTQVEILENCAITDFKVVNDAVADVSGPTETFSAAHYVLTAGAWTSQFPGLHGIIPDIRPMRGQIFSMQMPHERFVRHAGSLDDFYYVPRNDGRILIGSTVEDAGFNKSVSNDVTDGFLKKLETIFPNSVYFKAIESWAGLRPVSEDRFPVLGETALGNLYVASGHFRNGILLMPITARLMADMILDQKVSPLIRPFSTARFFRD
ncbi:FAD-dependent oxidoreductase [bacterium]|nr:FAD-dependent oxidoreductase [bacterium]